MAANQGRRHRFARSVLLTACLAAGSARAADFTWSGGGVSLTIGWASAFNWAGFKAPPSATTTDLTFAGTAGLANTQNIANPFVLNTLTFDPSAASFLITGQPLAFSANDTGAAINQNSPNSQVILSGIVLNNDLALAGSGAGELVLDGPFSGPGDFVKTSAGPLTLDLAGLASQVASLQVFKGAATITNNGTLSFTANGQTGFGSFSSFFVEADSSLHVTGGAHVTALGTPSVHNNGVLTVDGNAQLRVVPNPQNVGELRIGFAGSTSVLSVSNGGLVVSPTIQLGSTFPGKGLLDIGFAGNVSTSLLNIVDGQVRVISGGLVAGHVTTAPGLNPTFAISDIFGGNVDALQIGDASDTDFNGTIVDGPDGRGSLKKVGSGTLTLNHDNTFSGRTDIADGTVRVASPGALQNSIVTLQGGLLAFNVPTASIAALAGNSGEVNLSNTTLTVGTPHRLGTFNGRISGIGSGGLVVVGNGDGSGALTLGGTAANTFAGLTRVVGGTLIGTKTGVNVIGGDLSVEAGGNVDLSASSDQLPDAAVVTVNGGALNLGPSETTGQLVFAGAGPTFFGVNNLTLTTQNNFALLSAVPLSVGPSTIGLAGNAGGGVSVPGPSNMSTRWNLGGAVREFNVPSDTLHLLGRVSNGELRKTGAGVLALDSVMNDYAQGTRIEEGTLQISTDANLGQVPVTASNNVTLAGGTLRATETVTLNPNRLVLFDGPATSAFDVASNKTLTLAGSISFNTNAAAAFEKRGGGELRLAGGGQFDPNVFIKAVVSSGTLRLSAKTFANTILNDATFVVDGGTSAIDTVDNSGLPGSSGQTTVQSGAELDVFNVRQSSLTVNGRVGISPSGMAIAARTSVVRTLSIGPAGRFDLANRRLVVDYGAGAASPIASVRQMIVNGFTAGGAAPWSGGGLTSTNAQKQANLAIGYAEAAEITSAGDLFGDVAVDGSAVLVRTTLAGDANLDGTVDFNDLVRLAQNYNGQVSATTESWWTHGDFNYDGVVDFNDLVKLAQNYNGALPAASAGLSTGFQQDFARALAQVPEPGVGVLVGIALCGLVRRRRSR